MFFADRHDAGRKLAEALTDGRRLGDAVILALPRGGVPVGYEVAEATGAPLDVFVVRKLGVPGHEELAMGALASGGIVVLNEDVLASLGIPEEEVDAVARREAEELMRRERLFREDRPPPEVRGRTVVLVDDGLATGSTMLAAIGALRRLGPARILVAVPVAAPETCRRLAEVVEEMVCLDTPEPFFGVGQFYADFAQTSDDEVRALLHRAAARFAVPMEPTP